MQRVFKKVYQRKAVTLLELIMAMVIIGTVVSTMVGILGQVNRQAVFSEDIANASFYAQSLMEEVMMKRFDENSAAPWSVLGRDANEASNDRHSFDDVDDYINTNDTNVTTIAGFNRRVAVDYVNLVGNAWQANVSSTDYKRIIVMANRAGSNSVVTLVGLKGAY